VTALARLRWQTAYLISRAGVAVGHLLPARVWYALSYPISSLCYLLLGRHRRPLVENLCRVLGEDAAPAAAKAVFRNFGRYVIDLYQLPSLGRDALRRRIRFDAWRQLDEALNGGNGAVFVTLHLGVADVGAACLAAYGQRVSVICETLPHRQLDDFVQGLRRDLGMQIIATTKPAATRTRPTELKTGVLRCLRRGEVLGMMFDVVTPGDGARVEFVGSVAEVSKAPARIALRSGARVLPGVVRRDAGDPTKLVPEIDFSLRFEPTGDEEADVQALSQAIAGSLEEFVRRFPEQWFAFRPLWRATAAAEAALAPAARWRGSVTPLRHPAE
jgi:KDO2-lipid IV(A) lauroyltransferase